MSVARPLTPQEQRYEDQSIDRLFAILPGRLQYLAQQHAAVLDEIILDLNQPVVFKIGQQFLELNNPDNPLHQPFSDEDLQYVLHRIDEPRTDGRVGVNGTLHRISVIRNRYEAIIGYTIRIGRIVAGVAEVLRPYIATSSMMVIGPPGKGKSTLLRDIVKIKAEYLNRKLVVVDTSGEIGGDGDTWHPYINPARRVQVPNPLVQRFVLLQVVGNHSPGCIVIDEMGVYAGDVETVESVARRGLQVIGTVHGTSLMDVYQNAGLARLIGSPDVETGRRRSSPAFTTAVEVIGRGKYLLHRDLAASVDRLLAGQEPHTLRLGDWGDVSTDDLLGEAS